MECVSSPGVTVELLADRLDLVAPLGLIRWTDWRRPGRETVEWWIEDLKSEAGRDTLPVSFVAVDDSSGEAVGGVTLAPSDMTEEQRGGRTPWIAGMIVRADRRSQGIGSVLMTRLEEWARNADIPQAWVVTDGRAVDFYRNCGWAVAETMIIDDGEATVLTKTLTRA
jgi:GNAT superfamily N-acetyltransferase